MSIEFYRVLHLCGIFMLLSGLAALWGVYVSSGQPPAGQRKALAIIHGMGMLFALLGGFGMAAKLGYLASFPLWLILKIVIWLVLGGSMVLAKRKASIGPTLVLIWVALGTLAAYLAITKPI